MSIWATTWAFEQTVKPVGRKFVLVCLANFADERGFCFPSQETLATMTDQGVSTVREHLKTLESDGYIDRQHRYAKHRGRTSDGFWLKAPEERLRPPSKPKQDLPPAFGAKSKRPTAKKETFYRQVSDVLPPKAGDDPLVTIKEPKELSAHASLMKIHYDRLSGKIPDPAAQGAAVKWLLQNYTEAQAAQCYAAKIGGDRWRVSWLTIKSEIGDWLQGGKAKTNGKRYTKHGEEIIEETEDYLAVMGPDGTPSYRGKTAKGMAMHSNYPVEVFEQSFK
jgi:hypothetical protein